MQQATPSRSAPRIHAPARRTTSEGFDEKLRTRDHRIGRIVVDVQHRGEIPVEAEALHAARHGRADALGQRRVADRARAPSPRAGAAGRRPGRPRRLPDRCAISARGPMRLAQGGGQRAHLGFAAEVGAEEHDGADTLPAQERRLRRVQHLALDADHHQRAGVEPAPRNVRAASSVARRAGPLGI